MVETHPEAMIFSNCQGEGGDKVAVGGSVPPVTLEGCKRSLECCHMVMLGEQQFRMPYEST